MLVGWLVGCWLVGWLVLREYQFLFSSLMLKLVVLNRMHGQLSIGYRLYGNQTKPIK